MAYKNPQELANQILKPKTNRRTLRDLDDFQSYLFPDVTAQEFIEGLKSGKIDYPGQIDTAAEDTLSHAILGETGLSPREYNDILKNYANLRKKDLNKVGPRFYKESYLKRYDDWVKAGKPIEDVDDDSNFYYLYAPKGYLNYYRPKEQWGQSNKIHARDEWESKFDPEGKIHEGFNPFKAGYDKSRASWDNFINTYGQDVINPKYAKILEWLDENKGNF